MFYKEEYHEYADCEFDRVYQFRQVWTFYYSDGTFEQLIKRTEIK